MRNIRRIVEDAVTDRLSDLMTEELITGVVYHALDDLDLEAELSEALESSLESMISDVIEEAVNAAVEGVGI